VQRSSEFYVVSAALAAGLSRQIAALDPTAACRQAIDRRPHRDQVAALVVGAIDQQPARAPVAHFGEGDLLRAVGHGPMIPPIEYRGTPLGFQVFDVENSRSVKRLSRFSEPLVSLR